MVNYTKLKKWEKISKDHEEKFWLEAYCSG